MRLAPDSTADAPPTIDRPCPIVPFARLIAFAAASARWSDLSFVLAAWTMTEKSFVGLPFAWANSAGSIRKSFVAASATDAMLVPSSVKIRSSASQVCLTQKLITQASIHPLGSKYSPERLHEALAGALNQSAVTDRKPPVYAFATTLTSPHSHSSKVSVRAFSSTADLAIAVALVAVTVSTLLSGQRPQRARSWLFFAAASITLVVHAGLAAFGSGDAADMAALFEVVTLALFAVGFVLLYGADREHLRTIETHAERDATTGLLNRRAFREVVGGRLRKAGRATASALAVLDLDGFKEVNDSRGHPVGDRILKLVATAIRVNLRPGDVAARYGGDEFVIFLDRCGPEEASRVLQRIRTVIASVSVSAGASVTASVGVALSGGTMANLDDLIRTADDALIEVKRTGKDQLRVVEGLAH